MPKIKCKFLVLSALLLLLLLPVVSADENHVNITFVGWSKPPLLMAKTTNPYNESINFTYIQAYNMSTWGPSDELLSADLKNQDIIVTYMLTGPLFDQINRAYPKENRNGTVFIDVLSSGKPAYFLDGNTLPTFSDYFNNMGAKGLSFENTENLLVYLAKEYGNRPGLTSYWKVQAPIVVPAAFIYHPDGDKLWYNNTSEYLEWYKNNSGNHSYNPDNITIGIWTHKDEFMNSDTQVLDSLVRNFESKGCNVIVGFDTFNNITDYYCNENKTPLVQCAISLKSFALNVKDYDYGVNELQHLNVPVLKGMIATESTDPADVNRGFSSDEAIRKTVSPNRDGMFEYIVLGKQKYLSDNGSNDSNSEYTIEADPTQVEWMVNRAINWAKLKKTPVEDKKVAVIYYNYPSGKDNIGASYLDAVSSMRQLLFAMKERGYNVTEVPNNSTELLKMIQAQGINAGSWAPGVMDEMVKNRTPWGLQLIPMETYHEWFRTLPENLQNQTIAEWGEPWAEDLPQNKSVMIWKDEATGEKYIVIPAVRFGNVWLMPQPARGFMQNNDTLYHSSLVPPPHQYIAFYLWLNKEWKPDAIINMGTHGTQEWLPGLAYGMNRSSDWSPVLLQDIPSIYPYIIDNVGEGLTAEYRGNALIIDHLTPTLERSGLSGELGNLALNVQEWYDNVGMGPDVQKGYQKAIVDDIVKLRLDEDLNAAYGTNITASELYNYSTSDFDAFVKAYLHEYLEDIRSENIPYGMHVLGQVPSASKPVYNQTSLTASVREMLGNNFEKNVTLAFYSDPKKYPSGIPSNDSRVDELLLAVLNSTANTTPEEAQTLVYGSSDPNVTMDLEQASKERAIVLGSEMTSMVRAMLGSSFEENVSSAFYSDPKKYPSGIPFNDTKVNRLVFEVIRPKGNSTPEAAQVLVYGSKDSNITRDLEKGLKYRDKLLACGWEIEQALSALEGGYIQPGDGGDPVRNPNALPSGRNFYSIYPALYPSKVTWDLGSKQAQRMLEDYYDKHGEYPKKVSFSRFGVEFIRDHGTLEAEALYLLGVEPTWDPDTQEVNGLRLMNESELLPSNGKYPGRPRIDVVYATAGMRDAFPEKIKMIDQAVKLASEAPPGNYPNYVNESTEAIYEELYGNFSETYDNETAEKKAAELATMRCFAVKDGTYEIGVANAIGASGTWENDKKIAELYLDKMGYAYGEGIWGEKASELLKGNLRTVDASVHSSSSNLYDTLDNDDFFQYFGGLNLAARYVRGDGKTPEMYVSDTRNPDAAKNGMMSMKEYLKKNERSRYFNDKWIEGMKNSGYAGGRMMSEFVNNLFGWEVSNPDLVDDSDWERTYNTYVNDPATKEWLKQNNPDAYQALTARMLETVRHEYWKPSDEVVTNLAKEYEESVAENGPACCHHTCGNPLLDTYVSGLVSVPGYREKMDAATKSPQSLQGTGSQSSSSSGSSYNARKAVMSNKTATSSGLSENSSQASNKAETGYGTDSSAPAPEKGASDSKYVEGYEMKKEAAENKTEGNKGGMSFSGADLMGTLLVLAAVGAIFLGFKRKKL